MPTEPLVSCIMPTANRRKFVGQAIWYFLRQDYPNKELIVVDDGEDRIADLIPGDPRIRYFPLDERRVLGAKRNLACELAQGELVAHWDDDDWQGPHRLRVQVEELRRSGADVCGAAELLYYRLAAGEAWRYRYPAGGRSWVAGCTMLYRRSAWSSSPFPEIDVAEDTEFVWRLSSDQVHAIADPSLYVALIHGRNTGGKNLRDPAWEQRPLSEVTAHLADDRDFYVTLRNGGARPPSARPGLRRPSLTVAAEFNVYSGYGSMAEYLVLGMTRAGAEVRVEPLSFDPAGLSEELLRIIARRQPADDLPVLYFCWPRGDLERFRGARNLFINTMWESDRLPAPWPAELDRARALIVPTRFVADTCRASGVRAPIEVIPEGVDPEVYHYEERPARPGLTTLTIGPIDDRKHVPLAIGAWKRAFAGDADARLIIKTQYGYRNYEPDDPRIRYVDCIEPTRGIAHWYRRADVLLALGNEGFGLPLIEAMATGLPVVALESEGQADVCREASGRLLTVEPTAWEPYDNAHFGRCGQRGVPAVTDVVARLRWVAEHRAEACAMGREAARWVARHRNVWAKGPAVLEVMERGVHPPRPLRRRRVHWVPTWNQPCGIAQHTAHLVAELSGGEVRSDVPDLRGVRLLHIEHALGLFDDVDLRRHVARARASGIPVCVTQHAVGEYPYVWEGEVSALVAPTRSGAARLRKRWHGKPVEHIPPGCPAWFPPRKRTRGRVLGAFGFLERHKGFWHLLEVLRRLPDCELVMVSYAKSAELEARFEEDAAGLPVRRSADFLPVAEAAQRLAAEADALVYWYDETRLESASAAARVGLATGVPVLTSPTSWFRDLKEATYQAESLIDGVRRLLDDTDLRRRLTTAARDYCHQHSWPRIAERHRDLWRSLER